MNAAGVDSCPEDGRKPKKPKCSMRETEQISAISGHLRTFDK